MTTEQKSEDDQSTTSSPVVGLNGIVEQYRKIREHAETYPYVWASYLVVYGGFGLWATYRWRKLRKTEDRVRALQERLRKLVATEESAGSATATPVEKFHPSAEKTSQTADKASKS